MKNLPLVLAVAIPLLGGGQALARHVTYQVAPASIEKQPFSFTVNVKDAGEFKEFEITVQQKAGNRPPIDSATGSVAIRFNGKKKAAFPSVTKVQSNGAQTYTFRVALSDLDRARFTFTETSKDMMRPFGFPGDYWVFDMNDFVGSPKK